MKSMNRILQVGAVSLVILLAAMGIWFYSLGVFTPEEFTEADVSFSTALENFDISSNTIPEPDEYHYYSYGLTGFEAHLSFESSPEDFAKLTKELLVVNQGEGIYQQAKANFREGFWNEHDCISDENTSPQSAEIEVDLSDYSVITACFLKDKEELTYRVYMFTGFSQPV